MVGFTNSPASFLKLRIGSEFVLAYEYKILERYEECGLEGLSDRTRRPFRYANQLPEQVETAIVTARREKPNWGARKIRERLLRRLPHAVKVPACSTIHAVLDRHGLVARPTRSRTR